MKAHIHGEDFLWDGLALCGEKDPAVYVRVREEHRKNLDNPRNNICSRCEELARRKHTNII